MKIKVKSVTKIFNPNTPFQVQALANISLNVNPGEIIGIIGPSGSGKSCLLRCLAGAVNPTAEEIAYNFKGKIGLVIQEPEQQFFLDTVFAEVAFALSGRDLTAAEIEKKVHFALSQVNYQGSLQKSPFRLSGGEKKRIALASILVMEPDCLMLDEPTAGLDNSGLLMISKVIRSYQQLTKPVLIVSHDLDFLYSKVERFLVLDKGSLIADFKKNDFPRYFELLNRLGVGSPEKIKLLAKNPPQFIRELLTES